MLCALTDVKLENQITDSSADALLIRLIAVASDALQRKTGRLFGQTIATGEVIRAPDVTIGSDGTLRVRLRTPRITTVSALAYRTGTPQAAWTALDLTTLDWDPDPIRASSLVRAYAGLAPARVVWAQIAYTAGWLCDFPPGAATDLPPGDLQEVVIWWTGWLYRSKDAPFDRTANQLTGTVTIPDAMPRRLKAAVERWTAHAVV